MKVILLQDVAKLGRKFAIVDVPDGYGINKLIPKGMAKPATPENIKAVQQRASVYAHEEEVNEAAFAELIKALDGITIEVEAEANTEGRLFQAVKPEKIAEAIIEATKKTMSAVEVSTHEPVKTIGEHTVLLSQASQKKEITIIVKKA